jgi:iron complex transport system substrate-binding protein
MRIVSLVPSLTETLLHFGAPAVVVGRTRWCTEPAVVVESIETVGGTKNPDIERIVALAPDLVVVNREENRLEDYEALVGAGLCVHVTHPCSVEEAATMLEELGEASGVAAAGRALALRCREALAQARRAVEEARRRRSHDVRVFCPIWRRPWMTFREKTYIGDVLAQCGGVNVFGDRAGADFFEVGLDEVVAAAVDLVVLPDEPFVFEEKHALELREAGIEAPALFVDGKDLAWYGPRLPQALGRLSALQAPS